MKAFKQTTDPRRILLVFNSFYEKAIIKEVFSQLDSRIILDLSPNNQYALSYFSRHQAPHLPGLILTDDPRIRPMGETATYGLVVNLPSDLPVVVFLPAKDIPVKSAQWSKEPTVFYYPKPEKPSEWKYYLKRSLNHYAAGEASQWQEASES